MRPPQRSTFPVLSWQCLLQIQLLRRILGATASHACQADTGSLHLISWKQSVRPWHLRWLVHTGKMGSDVHALMRSRMLRGWR